MLSVLLISYLCPSAFSAVIYSLETWAGTICLPPSPGFETFLAPMTDRVKSSELIHLHYSEPLIAKLSLLFSPARSIFTIIDLGKVKMS